MAAGSAAPARSVIAPAALAACASPPTGAPPVGVPFLPLGSRSDPQAVAEADTTRAIPPSAATVEEKRIPHGLQNTRGVYASFLTRKSVGLCQLAHDAAEPA
jgi:hypothetical protein